MINGAKGRYRYGIGRREISHELLQAPWRIYLSLLNVKWALGRGPSDFMKTWQEKSTGLLTTNRLL